VDSNSNVFISGQTDGLTTGLASLGGFQEIFGGGSSDYYIAKFNVTGTLTGATLLGGNGDDKHNFEEDPLHVDLLGNIYLTGHTTSTDYPLQNAYDSTFVPINDIVLSKLSNNLSALLYSTYLGGDWADIPYDLAINEDVIFVTGYTSSTADFNLNNPYQGTNNGSNDAFVIQLNTTSNTIEFGTYLGGASEDKAFAIAYQNNQIYITGYTTSTNFPTKNAYDTTCSCSPNVFVSKFSPLDTSDPVIAGPSNFSYEYQSTGNTINWSAGYQNPLGYNVYQDTSLIQSGTWDNDTIISVNIDGLGLGMHNFTFIVTDVLELLSKHSVFVNVTDTTLPNIVQRTCNYPFISQFLIES